MANSNPPKKNTAYSFEIGLWSQADPTALKSAPTIASGDFKISVDGAAPTNCTNTPAASGTVVTVALTASEMNGDRIHVVWQDVAGAEWISGWIMLYTNGQTNDDIYSRLGAPVGASLAADVATLQADTDDIQTRIPSALVGGRMSSQVGAMAVGVVDAAALATDAAQEIGTAVVATTVDGSYTVKQALQIAMGVLAGKVSGGATATVTIRDVGDTRNLVVATVDADGNRSAITLSLV